MAAFLRNIIAFVYPRLCVICNAELSPNGKWFCLDCFHALQENCQSRNPCGKCGINLKKGSCACDAIDYRQVAGIGAIFDFDETIREVAHNIKYQGRFTCGYDCANFFAPLAFGNRYAQVDAVTVVPLFWTRQLSRGYNQVDGIARGICAGLGGHMAYMPQVLKRKRSTKTQTKLNRARRQQNVEGAFMVVPQKRSLVQGKKWLLVDDVITTGATTLACAHALTEAGALEVHIASLARD